MTHENEDLTKVEHHLRAMLEDDSQQLDARVRSRLTRARYAALEEARAARTGFWRTLATSSRRFVPVGTVAVGVLAAILILTQRSGPPARIADARPAFEELEMLADAEALELIEDWELGFYEWAAAQSDAAENSG